jgi:hypothetical protein
MRAAALETVHNQERRIVTIRSEHESRVPHHIYRFGTQQKVSTDISAFH